MRRVAIALTTRGNFGKMLSTMRAIRDSRELELRLLVGGGIVGAAFGDFLPAIRAEGFAVDRQVDYLDGLAGDLASMTASAARAVEGFGRAFAELEPDVAIVIADRYEALSVAFAATCRAIPIAHLEGGEASGSIDDRIRHAITKLAHVHFPASPDAAERLLQLGEDAKRIHLVGSPSIDIIAAIDVADLGPLRTHAQSAYPGAPIDFAAPFLLVSQHPVVGEHDDAQAQAVETAAAIREIGLPVVWIQPNMDAGNVAVRGAIDAARPTLTGAALQVYPALPLQLYARAMRACACLVGNTSSGIREAAYLGTPAVNIGTRQTGRARGRNVVDVPYRRDAIAAAIRSQLAHGRYASDPIYGFGRAGARIADVLASADLGLQK